MKKLIYTLPFIILLGCTPDFEDIKPPSSDYIVDIFQIESTTVRDGDKVVINFESASTYTLSLTEEFTNVTYTNEKFNSVIGANTLTIFTKAIPKGSFKFTIKDSKGDVIKQTKKTSLIFDSEVFKFILNKFYHISLYRFLLL